MEYGADSTPERVGGFRVIRRLATGGTSDVLLARAEGPHGFERVVVLKLLLQQYRDNASFERMFAREAAAYARLSHPAIVKLYDFFAADGQLVMVLEYVDGLPLNKLRALLRQPRGEMPGVELDDRASLFVASRIFSALAAAHTARDAESGEFLPVIHRDVNPSNVLIPWDGHVKLADFGIAKVGGIMSDTQAGYIKGTYGYMAPEQVRGEPVTPRADVYAAMLLLWELLTRKKAIVRGQRPELEVLRAMAEPQLPDLVALRPDLPHALVEAVRRGLEPVPDRRAILADEMVSVLRSVSNLDEGRERLVEALSRVRPLVAGDDMEKTLSQGRQPVAAPAPALPPVHPPPQPPQPPPPPPLPAARAASVPADTEVTGRPLLPPATPPPRPATLMGIQQTMVMSQKQAPPLPARAHPLGGTAVLPATPAPAPLGGTMLLPGAHQAPPPALHAHPPAPAPPQAPPPPPPPPPSPMQQQAATILAAPGFPHGPPPGFGQTQPLASPVPPNVAPAAQVDLPPARFAMPSFPEVPVPVVGGGTQVLDARPPPAHGTQVLGPAPRAPLAPSLEPDPAPLPSPPLPGTIVAPDDTWVRPRPKKTGWIVGTVAALVACGVAAVGIVFVLRFLDGRRAAQKGTTTASTATASAGRGTAAGNGGATGSGTARGTATATGTTTTPVSTAGTATTAGTAATTATAVQAATTGTAATTTGAVAATTTATSTLAPTATAAPSDTSTAAPANGASDSTTGQIDTSGAPRDHRIWVDGQVLGQTPAVITVRCGRHDVRVGSAGSHQSVDVPCGSSVSVGWR